MDIKDIEKEINRPIDSFDVRKLIMESSPPFEWCNQDYSHPIQKIGSYYFGIGDGFDYDEQKVKETDELTLWKLYALIQNYWSVQYQTWHNRNQQVINNMRNCITIKPEDVGKKMLRVYEKYYDWNK